MELKQQSDAYNYGYHHGAVDRSMQHTSRYAYVFCDTESEYHEWYSCGYRDGNHGLQPRFSEL